MSKLFMNARSDNPRICGTVDSRWDLRDALAFFVITQDIQSQPVGLNIIDTP